MVLKKSGKGGRAADGGPAGGRKAPKARPSKKEPLEQTEETDAIEDDSVLTVDDDEPEDDWPMAGSGNAARGQGRKATRPQGDRAKQGAPAKKQEDSYAWASAISFNSMSITTMLRELLEEMGATFKREKSEKSYSQLYAIVPFPRVAYVFRFKVEEPCDLIIDIYDINPAISGSMTFMEIPSLTDSNIHFLRRLFRKLTEKLPRPPWKFTMAQRVQHGLLNPDILRARKNWMTIGIAR